ncbi:MAG: MotA/TolQ/ExbB proton channel family protein [Planctomycetaceae bacterium]|jgi:biopolymer transport protein ExbB|nr:MotA/TolQ/ExbB proton channel family protein [Planctomycetaceae bacterium]
MLRKIITLVTVLSFIFFAAILSNNVISIASGESSSNAIGADTNLSDKNVSDTQNIKDNNNNDTKNNSPKSSSSRLTFFGILQASGIIGYIIIFLSFVVVAVVIEFLFTVRRELIIPHKLIEIVQQHLIQGQLGAAIQSCNDNQSPLAKILVAGMKGFEFGWDAIEKNAEDAIETEASRLYRKIEYLNLIGNIAPMLGLLGTVVGMIIAFQHLAESGGVSKPTELAQGIYLALLTTVEGLIVALPALGLYSILAGQIASLISETTNTVEQILNPIRRSLMKKNKV